jgi:L-phenylalanine/L-methionine N-acetyltransferase
MAEVSFRRARPGDVDFLLALVTHEEVAPFLAAGRASDREALLAEVERSEAEPEAFGRFVIEVDARPAGSMRFERVNERSRIAQLGGLAVHPDFRGRRVAEEAARELIRHLVLELGFHRLQLETYGFNERAMAHAERVGFTREGVKRRAYLYEGEWVDGVLFGLVQEDLGA